jgi:hypothetical protein
MRKAPSFLLLSLVVPALSALPVITPPVPKPRPVAPEVHAVAVAGVDDAALRTAAGRASKKVSADARSDILAPQQRGRAPSRPAVFTKARGTANFELLGVTWPARTAADLTVLVRTHGEDGWTEWTALDPAPTPEKTEGDVRAGTEPVYAGPSDGYQVRIDVRSGTLPAGVRVDLIDPGESPADDAVGAGAPMATAAAAAGQPRIYSRAQWGADESLRGSSPNYSTTIKAGFVHHTAGANGYAAGDVPKILRGIYAYHVKGNGWSDIGYNFLVDRFGRLWEGRYGGITRPVVGAHTGGFNTDTFGVSALGNYDKVAAPAAMTDSISRLLAWKLSLYYRNPAGKTTLTSSGGGTSRYPAGRQVTINVVSGHRDVGYTSCPGKNLYAKMGTIRSKVLSVLGPGLVSPSALVDSTTIRARSGVMRATQTSRVTVTQHATGRVIRASNAVTGAFDLSLPRLDSNQAGLEAGLYDVTMTSASGSVQARPYVSTKALTGSQGIAGATTTEGLLAVATRSDAGTASVRVSSPGGSASAPLDLGGGIVGAPAVAARGDGRIVVAGRGTNDMVYLRERAVDGTWAPWTKAVGPVSGRPAVVAASSGALHIFGRGADGALWHWTSTEPGVWGAGERVGGLMAKGSAPAAAEAPTGGVHVVVQGNDHAVWYTTFQDHWSSWRSLGGAVIGDPSITAVDAGSAIVSAWAANSRPYVVTVTDNSRGSRWSAVPNLLASTSPALVGAAGADPVLIARHEPTQVQVSRRTAGAWSDWASFT